MNAERHKRLVRGMVLKQPWARLVVEGVFPALVRTVRAPAGERVGVVAKGIDYHVFIDGRPVKSTEFPSSSLIGSVRIVQCLQIPFKDTKKELMRLFGPNFTRFYPKHFLPKKPPIYLWILDRPRPYKRPVKIEAFGGRVWQHL